MLGPVDGFRCSAEACGEGSGHRETSWRLASGGGVQQGCKGHVLCQDVVSREVIGPQEGDRGTPPIPHRTVVLG